MDSRSLWRSLGSGGGVRCMKSSQISFVLVKLQIATGLCGTCGPSKLAAFSYLPGTNFCTFLHLPSRILPRFALVGNCTCWERNELLHIFALAVLNFTTFCTCWE